MSPVAEHPTVITAEGAVGQVESNSPEAHDGAMQVLLSFPGGERLWVPAEKLILQEDGNFQLQMSLAEISLQHTRPTVAARPADLDEIEAAAPTQRQPAVQAFATPPVAADPPPAPEARQAESHLPPAAEPAQPASPDALDHIQISRVVESYREDIGATLLREEVEIHRVPVNEFVDEAPPIRYEDDRIIIPVLEEVLQVEKRLLVKEEVVITKRRTQVPAEQRTLREDTHVMAAPAATAEADTQRYRQHYEAQAHAGARGFAYYEPAYSYGQALRASPRYRGWPWEQLEPEARALWERDNPGTWETVQPAVRFAWSPPPSPK